MSRARVKQQHQRPSVSHSDRNSTHNESSECSDLAFGISEPIHSDKISFVSRNLTLMSKMRSAKITSCLYEALQRRDWTVFLITEIES